MARVCWTVRLSAAAEQDYQNIFRWTREKFGLAQAQLYANTISAALKDLRAGPETIGVKACDEIGINIKTLHIARKGRKGRHFLMCRTDDAQGQKMIVVLRILHESMDLARHLPPL